MSKVFTDVSVFLNACGQEFPKSPSSRNSLSDLYMKLIEEEYTELMEAEACGVDAEIADACFDLIWVLVGYMHSRGWDCNAIWEEGSASNLSKIDKKTGAVIRRSDGKILKPEGWMPPNFSKFVE